MYSGNVSCVITTLILWILLEQNMKYVERERGFCGKTAGPKYTKNGHGSNNFDE